MTQPGHVQSDWCVSGAPSLPRPHPSPVGRLAGVLTWPCSLPDRQEMSLLSNQGAFLSHRQAAVGLNFRKQAKLWEVKSLAFCSAGCSDEDDKSSALGDFCCLLLPDCPTPSVTRAQGWGEFLRAPAVIKTITAAMIIVKTLEISTERGQLQHLALVVARTCGESCQAALQQCWVGWELPL